MILRRYEDPSTTDYVWGPGDLEWSHAPGKWTLGDIVRHLAGIERDMYAENMLGHRSRYPGHGRELAASSAGWT